MRRVGRQRQVDGVAIKVAVAGCAHVIFHVARALDIIGHGGLALEFREDCRERLAHDIGQHVQAAAVRHTQYDFTQAHLAAALHDLLDARNERLAAIDAEAFRAGIFFMQELFEHLGGDQALQDRALAVDGEIGLVARLLDALLNPSALDRIADMHEFNADRAAIGLLEGREDFIERRGFHVEKIADENRAVEVFRAEAVMRGVELRMVFGFLEMQRVEVGNHVAARAVSADQAQRLYRVHGGAANIILRVPISGALRCGRGIGSGNLDGVGREARTRRHAAEAVCRFAVFCRSPAGAVHVLQQGNFVIVQRVEKIFPAGVDLRRVLQELTVEMRDIFRVRTGQECQIFVLFALLGHFEIHRGLLFKPVV